MYGGKGLGELVLLGIAALVVLVAAVPIAAGYGVAWLLAPRVGMVVWTAHFWASTLWLLIVAAFFGSAWWPWGRKR